jgi:hypothetical protein
MEEESLENVIVEARVFAYGKGKSTGLIDLSDGDKYLARLAYAKNMYRSRIPFWCTYDTWKMEEAAMLLSGMLPSNDEKGSVFAGICWTDKWFSDNSDKSLVFNIFTSNYACAKYVREILLRSSMGEKASPRAWLEYARAKGLLPHVAPFTAVDNSPLLVFLESTEEDNLLQSSELGPSITQSKPDLSYSTTRMDIQARAIARFFNPRRDIDAKREEVVEWIMAEAAKAGLKESRKLAESIFTIIKPDDHDPKKKRGYPL